MIDVPGSVPEYSAEEYDRTIVIRRNNEPIGYINKREGDSWKTMLNQLVLKEQEAYQKELSKQEIK